MVRARVNASEGGSDEVKVRLKNKIIDLKLLFWSFPPFGQHLYWDGYHRQLRSFWFCSCDDLRALINSLLWWFFLELVSIFNRRDIVSPWRLANQHDFQWTILFMCWSCDPEQTHSACFYFMFHTFEGIPDQTILPRWHPAGLHHQNRLSERPLEPTSLTRTVELCVSILYGKRPLSPPSPIVKFIASSLLPRLLLSSLPIPSSLAHCQVHFYHQLVYYCTFV